MATFDSPIERCPLYQHYVLLDQTQEECAAEHSCGLKDECPLRRYFQGRRFDAQTPDRSNADGD